MKKQLLQVKHVVGLYAFLLVVWGFYRALFKFPEEIEELVLKPVIWLLPTLWLVKKEGLGPTSLGWTGRNLWRSVYLAIGLGIVFAAAGVITNTFKYAGAPAFSLPTGVPLGTLPFLATLGVSLATAISEETVFRGFLFNRLWKNLKAELPANIITSLGWGIIHLPVLIFVYKLGLADIGLRFALTAIFGFGSALLFARTENITSSVLLHVFWSWPIILFR